MSDIETTLVAFIGNTFLGGQARDLDATTPLLDLGILDSMTTLVLLAFIEKQFGVAIAVQNVKPEDLRSVGDIAALIRRRR
jgi:acyl carrier protein